jgi:hypothetical protein
MNSTPRWSGPAAAPPPAARPQPRRPPRRFALEAELAEVKGRLNGLLFLLVGAVLVQIALRLLRL